MDQQPFAIHNWSKRPAINCPRINNRLLSIIGANVENLPKIEQVTSIVGLANKSRQVSSALSTTFKEIFLRSNSKALQQLLQLTSQSSNRRILTPAFTLKQCLILAVLFTVISRTAWGCKPSDPVAMPMVERHEWLMAHHGSVYHNDMEKPCHFHIFKSNVKLINSFNTAGKHKYTLGVNQFADMTKQEFKASHTGFKNYDRSKDDQEGKIQAQERVGNTDERRLEDSRCSHSSQRSGAVWKTGCGWAFSAVSAMEVPSSELISLSEQDLMDCAVHGKDYGCNNGLMYNV
ncbi:hypothetical protein ZIOFF_040721 [Zingiber officinale]|uniref:Cathepsin propeptide inhibitor domain-containing protein n=1 Tax=Zingiber officinale TaxID=94328 RepID=A0A8J5GG26_ZINOF|nr:hypothetical protein ZIOFF_040721 [Zingiber officinale]